LTVAHVSLIKEEVVAVEEVAEAATEPEVAKKGKARRKPRLTPRRTPNRGQTGRKEEVENGSR